MARAVRPPGETTEKVLELYLAGVTTPSALVTRTGLSESTVGYHLRIVRAMLTQYPTMVSISERDCEHCLMGRGICGNRAVVERVRQTVEEANRADGPRFTVIMDCPHMGPYMKAQGAGRVS